MKTIRLLAALGLFISTTVSVAQTKAVDNTSGKYTITVPENWSVKRDGTITDVFAPDESSEDEWREFIGVSLAEANGASLDDAFDYYMKEDFPAYYAEFKIEKQGAETIHGKKVRWVVYSFATSTTVNADTKSARLFNLFCLVHDNDTLYSLNGIAEASRFGSYEPIYFQIIRSFKIHP
jgi:hypothetical protein